MQAIKQRSYKYPHELFELVSKTESFHERVKLLVDYQSFAIRTILQFNFTPTLKLDLPEGAPLYQADEMPVGYSMGRIDSKIKILSKLVLYPGQKGAVGLDRIKKERMFVTLLESMSAGDALVIIAMKEKELEKLFPMLDATLAKAAFPNIIP